MDKARLDAVTRRWASDPRLKKIFESFRAFVDFCKARPNWDPTNRGPQPTTKLTAEEMPPMSDTEFLPYDEEKARQQFAASRSLQEEFSGEIETYLAYLKAERGNRFKVQAPATTINPDLGMRKHDV